MRKILVLLTFTLIFTAAANSQTKRPHHSPAKTAAKPAVDPGKVAGRTYTNATFNFEVTFPDEWLIPDSDFEAYMKKQGFDLSLKAPDTLEPASQVKINQAVKSVHILLTAYRSMPGAIDNAIVRISVEDLKANPQIKDAVDYLDAVTGAYANMKLPYDFKYSATKAEKLGTKQFGYIDTSTNAGKKRMYVTVRNGFAIIFTISYTKDEDLQTLRHVLEGGNFALK